jgi:hypothetical protein
MVFGVEVADETGEGTARLADAAERRLLLDAEVS